MCFRTFRIVFIYITFLLIFTGCSTLPTSGYHEMTFADGNKYSGNWENSKLHGYGTYTFANGATYIGNFVDGKYHGQGIYTEPGKRKYSGSWVYGQWTGFGVLEWFPTDTKYEGNFQNGQLTEAKITYKNGSIYEGKVSNLVPNGSGILTYPDGSTKTGNWSNNTCNGCEFVKAESNSTNNSDNIQINKSLDKAKASCKNIGFKEGTEKFGECVLELTK